MGNYLVDICHETEHRPILAYDENRDYDSWRSQIKEKLTELLGDMPERTEANLRNT